MRAIQFASHGSADVLTLDDVPVPEPGPGQVRVAVRVAGVNAYDWKLRSGAMHKVTLPHRPGLELAGVVDAVGEDAPLAVGDEVFGWANTGAYAEYALATIAARKPADLPWQDAAALPVAGEAALRVLRGLAVEKGEVLLIHGASGAVGSLATQLAVDKGATVVGTAGQAHFDYLSSLGATPVAYGDELVKRVREVTPRVDAVFDAAGQGALRDSVTLRGNTDRIVTIADPEAADVGIPFSGGEPGGRNTGVLTELADKAVAGTLRVRHARSYPLADAARAHEDSETGHSGGKLTLRIG